MSAFAGDTAAAGTTVSSIATEAWPPELRLSSMNGLGLLAEAYICLDSLDFAGAEDILRDTQTYLRITEYWPLLTTARLLAKLGLGQGQAEAERITRELAVTPAPPGAGDNTATEHLYAVLAAAWMASGDHREAGRILADKPEDSPHLAAARVSWLLGAQRDREAIQQGIALLDLPGHTIRTRAETQTMAAVAALREGESELAWLWLSAAAVAWESYGARMHIALMDPRDRRMLWELAGQQESPSVRSYLDCPVSGVPSVRLVTATLTPRETVVLRALAEHGGIRAVAEALVVSPHTIKAQLQSIYRKLGVSSRESALAVARELGLL